MRNVILELWNHGLAGTPSQPCGEVSVFKVSGVDMPIELLALLVHEGADDENTLWFGYLPTEQVLIVEAEVTGDSDGEFFLLVKNWQVVL
jgi:hypothetical protein